MAPLFGLTNPVFYSKVVALLSLVVIVLQSSSFVFVWLCIVLRCWLLLSLLFDEPIRKPLLAATGQPSFCSFRNGKFQSSIVQQQHIMYNYTLFNTGKTRLAERLFTDIQQNTHNKYTLICHKIYKIHHKYIMKKQVYVHTL